MFENIENLKLVNIYEGISATNISFVDKPSHVMVYKLFGESEYYFKGEKPLRLSKGQIMFIPKGSDYSVKSLIPGEGKYIAVRFEADGIESCGGLCKCTSAEPINLEDIFRTLNSLWLFRTSAKKHRCYSVFYHLLAFIANDTEHEYVGHNTRELLYDSINFLEKHIFDCNLSVKAIVEKSGVSGTYFRRCFAKIYGLTPKEYICEKRLLRARSIFDGGDFDSISDVAHAVGFEDALYFSKVFRKKYGVSPSGYIER